MEVSVSSILQLIPKPGSYIYNSFKLKDSLFSSSILSSPFLTSFYIGIVLLYLAVPIHALDPQRSLSQYNYEVWQNDDGLPSNYIKRIVQTPDGYIWFSTDLGLVRFDGVRFKIFDKSSTGVFGQTGISALLATRDGRLFFISNERLYVMKDGEVNLFEAFSNPIRGFNIPIFEDRSGNIWIANSEDGLIRIKDNQARLFTTKDGLYDDSVRAITEDRDGKIWVATSLGISHIDQDRFISYQFKNSLPGFRWTSLCFDKEGTLWVGSRRWGIYSFKEGKFTPQRAEKEIFQILSMYADRDGNIWIGTENRGLVRFSNGSFTYDTSRNLLPDEWISAIFEDREGNLWIGSRRGGAVKINNGKLITFSRTEGLPHDYVYSVYKDVDDSLWVGTISGLTHLNKGEIINYRSNRSADDDLTDNRIRAIHRDKKGNLWVGGIGLYIFKDGKFLDYGAKINLNQVDSISEDCNGNIWIGSSQSGLIKFQNNSFSTYTPKDGLPHQEVRTLYSDSQCKLWIGTREGLALFKDGEFKSYSINNGLLSNSIRTLFEDSKGNLWIGTDLGGISRIKNEKVSSYKTTGEFLKYGLYQILEDDKSNLWLGTKRGIYQVPLKSFEDVDNGRADELIPSAWYETEDGMRSPECTQGGRFNSWNNSRELLIFPTAKGFVRVDNGSIKKNIFPPPVYIEEILVNGKPIDSSGKFSLPPGRWNLEIRYTGLSFIASEKMQFKYMLEGFDSEWIKADNRRTAYYMNLPPGEYLFRVVASNSDGILNPTGASIEFNLQPHFFETRWFFALCIITLLLLLIGVSLLHARQVRLRHLAIVNERMRIARELHDTLLQNLAGLTWQLAAIKASVYSTSPTISQSIDKITEQLNNSLLDARRALRSLRTVSAENEDFISTLSNTAKRMLANSSIALSIHVEGTPPPPLSPIIEHNLIRITQESITNAIKHAAPNHINIRLQFKPTAILLSIEDDGCGFDPEYSLRSKESQDHFGLIGMRERAEQLDGQLTVRSRIDKGTEVIAVVPIKL
jgi:ligand-binding sensor domain-containing protein/signal transduction histidine kinase